MNLPADFVTRTRDILKGEYFEFEKALHESSPISIRLNPSKVINWEQDLSDMVAWSSMGYYLKERPQFTFDPLFHAGCYYVQEASSMFLEQAVKQYIKGDVTFLDLCAAPGGKSTLISSLLSFSSLLVSNEVIRSRANILAENISKWGYENVVVTNNDPEKIGQLTHFFDAILVDAPCSGEGMFRKDEKAILEWSEANVQLCRQRQQRILADIWPALKPEGFLLYSTCTFNLEENERNVEWICNELGAKSLPIAVDQGWGITPSQQEGVHGYRFYPHKTKGEGFFFAILQKDSDTTRTISIKKPKKGKENRTDLPAPYKNYIKDTERFTFHNQNENWFAIPSIFENEWAILKEHLHIIEGGIGIGEMKGKDFVPDQSLALSNSLNSAAFIVHDIDWNTAIAYLRKETLVLDDMPKGYILLTYRNQLIGFVKNIGNRANNLYPQEWRIRSPHIPLQEVTIL